MGGKIIRFIFFGNYFVGILAIALTIEATLQLRVPFNTFGYYLMIFCAPVAYYTYAYMGATRFSSSANPRTQWYIKHQTFLKRSQLLLTSIATIIFLYLFITNWSGILQLPYYYWLIVLVMLTAATLYYGLLPAYFFNLNLRNTGWLKPFIIGFIWACTANIIPLVVLRISSGTDIIVSSFWVWLFVKNWMFCTVNAVMFDIKDYAIDANHELKTFVVRIGIRKTIFYFLIPLLCIGMVSLLIYASIQQFPFVQIALNLVPFVLTIIVAFSMHARKNIMYYLIVIDGLILLKAVCGSTAILLLPG